MGVRLKLFLGFIIILSGCTTSRWIADPEPTRDLAKSVVVDSEPRILITNNPSPENPVLEISIINRRLLEVPMVYKSNRVIQRYRPKYGFLIAGVVVSAGTLYLAENLDTQSQKSQKNLLRATAGGVLVGSLLNMKPVGEPIATGEVLQFGQASISQFIDSTTTYPDMLRVILNGALNGESLVSGREFIVNQNHTIDLIDELNLSEVQLADNDSIELQLVTEHEVVDINIDVSSIMNRYIRISRQNTLIRSSPDLTDSNVITTVAPNSFLPLVSSDNDNFYRTTLGASTAYVSKSDGNLVWRVGAGYNSNFIVSTSGSQRGSVDIERDIPTASERNPDAIGIIITQESYPDEFKFVKNAHRSGDLVSEYFTKSLGVYEQNIIRLKSSYFPESLAEILIEFDQDGSIDFSQKDLFLYYAGAGKIDNDSTGVGFKLLSSDGSNGTDLNDLLSLIAKLNTRSNVLLFDTDFSNGLESSISTEITDSLNQVINTFISENHNSALFMAAEANQFASNYQSTDLRTDRIHGIFTYYFLQSIQSGNNTLPQIRDNLLRNVTFTSRRLHNRAQDPIIRFNSNFSLIRQE